MKKLSYYTNIKSINFRIKSCLVLLFTLLSHLTINAQTLTISSSGDNGPSSGTNWSISGTTLTVTGTANIRSSVIANALTNGSLSIVGNTTTFNATISESITATGNNTITVGSSTNTGTITVNSSISLSSAAIFNANTFELGNGINISTSSNSSLTFNSNLNFTTSGTTRRTISSAGGDIIIHADKDANGSGVLDLDYLTINPGAGNIIIRGETAAFNVGSTDGPYINGTGSFTFESSDASFGQTIYTTWFQLDQDNNGISGLTLGKIGNTANIEQNTNFTIAGPVNYYGGYVNITGTLTSSSGNILLKGISNSNTSVNISSGGGITKSAGTGTLTMQGHGRTHNGGTISTSGTGVLNVIIWSDFDGDNVGGGSTNHGTISTNGGHVWMGGSSNNAGSYNWNGLAVGDGPSVGASGANANALDIFGPITTNGGDLLLWAGNGFGGGFNGIATVTGYIVNVGSGDIVLITDVILGTGLSLFFMQSGGSFTLVPNDGDFGATFNWDGTTNTVSGYGTGWNFGGNFNYLWLENPASLTSLTIGKYEGMLNGSTPVVLGNSSNVTFANTTATSISGPISIYGGNITISQNLSSTVSGAAILLQANGFIDLSASRTIQTNNGNITLKANSGGSLTTNITAIDLNAGSQLLSTGGNITIGGGYSGSEGNVYAATNITNGGYAIVLETSTINAAGGHIRIYGNNVSSYGDGVFLDAVNISTTGNGTIGIYGDSYGGYNGTQYFGGITFENLASTIQTVNGNLTLKGILTNSQSTQGYAINFYRSPGSTGQTRHIQILSQTGNIQITADRGSSSGGGIGHSSWGHIYFGSPLNNSYTSTGSITFTYSGLVHAGANGFKVKTTGAVTYEPVANSFIATQTLPANTNYVLAENASSLTIGKTTNTANIILDASQTISGPIAVYGGNITINENLNTTSGNTSGNVLTKGSGDVILAASKSITTSGAPVILWANSDNASSDGSIALRNGSSIVTGSSTVAGGHIWIGGGSNGTTWNGLAVGSGYAVPGTIFTPSNGGGNLQSGIYFERNSISSFGGNIKIAGDGAATSRGIVSYGNTVTINSGSGKIELDGQVTSSATGNRGGILFGLHDNTVISTVNISSSATSGDAITINGVGRGTEDAIALSGTLNITSSGGGNIVMNGNALGTGRSIVAGNYYHGIMNIFANSGNISLNGNTKAVQVATQIINGLTSGPSKLNIGQGGSITSSSSDVFITADNIALAANGIGIISTGKVTIEPSSNSFANAITYPITNLSISNTITGLTLGKSTNTANITFGSATSIAGPITAYGGNININENINTASGGISGDILLKASGDIVLAASKSITTSSGDLIVWSNSDGATTNGSVLLRNQSSITTNGGHIWIGGGSGNTTWNSLTVGNGQAVSGVTFNTPVLPTTYESGIYLEKTTINSGGGNIFLSGTSSGTSSTNAFGILTFDVSSVNSGSGTITIKGGTGSNTVRGMVIGVQYSNQPGSLTLTSSSTQTTAIDIDCRSASNYGLTFEGTFDLISTQSGGISYTTIGSSATAGTRIGFNTNPGTLNILAASGNITVNTGSSGFEPTTTSNKAYFGAKSGTSVTSSSSNIRHITDDLTPLDGSMNFSSTGTLTIEPYGTSFASAFNTTLMTQTGLTGLTIGKSTNTANITFGSATSIAGPITTFGGTIAINENLSSSNGSTISLFGNSLTFGSTKTVTSANGQLVVAPQTASNSIGLGGASGTLSLPTSYFSTNFADGFSNIQIGSNSQTGAISSNAFTLRDNMTFLTTGSLTLGGIPVLGSNNVTLGSAISSITASTNGYFKTDGTGVVNRTIANGSNHLFPIGNALYNPVSIANNTGASDVFTAKVRDAVLKDGTSGTQMTDPLVNVTWDINKTNANASSGVDFTLQWNSSQEANSINSYRLNHYNNSTPEWEFAAGTSGSVSGSSTKTMTHTGYTGTFSPFAIGSGTTPLPVDLVSFDATPRNNSVDLTWTSFGDNKNPFNILKSNDGVNWKSIGTQVPNDNSVHYLFTDHQPAPVNYYQLSQIDNSNTLQYSDIRIVNLNSNKLVIFPNPNNGEFTIQSNHVVDFQVTDYTGKVILEGNNSNPLIKTNLTKGIYFIKITEGDKTTFSKLIVK